MSTCITVIFTKDYEPEKKPYARKHYLYVSTPYKKGDVATFYNEKGNELIRQGYARWA